MKIRGWRVEGFGVFSDYGISDLPGNLVLVHGPNEAGKSTLLAFLRGVLFGFSERRGGEPPYPPLRGGRHGGVLLVESCDGLYRIARLAGHRRSLAVVRPDGSEGGEADLQRLLGGADRQLFKSVFAFSLQDLAEMETLSSDQVRARIFSAGIAGAGRSAREVIDDLKKEAPKAGRIRELAGEAQKLSEDIAAAARRATEYKRALQLEEDASLEVGQLRTELAYAESRARRVSLLLDLWPTESERQQAVQSIAALPAVDLFPADPEERLAAALSEVRGALESSQQADRALGDLLRQRRAIETDDRLPALAPRAVDLAAGCAVHRERLSRTIELGGELKQHETRIVEVLNNLGPGWTEERLAALDTSLPAAEEVRGWQQRVATAKLDADSAASALASLQEREAAVEGSLRQIVARLDQPQAAVTEAAFHALTQSLTGVVEAMRDTQPRTARLLFDPGPPLEKTAATFAAARQEHARLDTISREAQKRLDSITVNEALVSMEGQVDDTARYIEVERHRLHHLDTLQATRRERQEALDRGVGELGGGWTGARVSAVPCDFAQLQQLRDFASRLASDGETALEAERALEQVAGGRSGREKDLQRLQDQLTAPETPPNDALDRQARTLRRVRRGLTDLARLESERRAEERVAAEAAGGEPAEPDARWFRGVPRAGWAIAALLAFLAAWRLIARDSSGSVWLAGACLLTIFLVLLFRLVAGYARASGTAVDARRRRTEETQRRIDRLDRDAAELRQVIADDARLLGLADLPTPEQVEDRQEQWAADRDARRRRDDLVAEARRLGQELESWRESEERRKDESRQAIDRAAESRRAWEGWLSAKGLMPSMAPEAARDLIRQLRSLQERIAECAATADRLRIERGASRAWRVKAEAILATSGDTEAGGADMAALFDKILELQRRCREEAARARERASLEREVADWARKLAAAQAAVARAAEEAVSAARTAYGRALAEWQSTATVRTREKEQLAKSAGGFACATAEWEAWQASRGLDRRMSPDGMIDFFAFVRRGREEIEQRDRVKGELGFLRAAIADWESHVAELTTTAGLPALDATVDSRIDGARALAQRCATDAELRREAQRIDDAIATARRQLEGAAQRCDHSAESLAALFAEAGVSSEQEFRRRLAHYREREALNQKIAEFETRVAVVLGSGPEADRMRGDLAAGRVSEWTAERTQLASEVESLREQHERAIRRHQDLARERHRLEEAVDIPNLELQLQAVRDELDAAVRQLRVTALAAALVADTLREFKRTRQPAVLANASQAFGRVTHGRYPRVVQTDDAQGVVALDLRGARHEVANLSRGTQEQLYLSMRLGLAREFAQRAAPLPLVMDDVLVNFDEDRARRMAVELIEFAAEQQVLLFTCHAFVRSMLVELDPGLRVIDLPLQQPSA